MNLAVLPLVLALWYPVAAPAAVQGPDVERYVEMVEAGQVDQVRKDLPSLMANFPDDPGVIYLQALVNPDASEAVKLYQTIVDSHPASEWADDALYKIYQFYQALGLVRTAELKLAQLRREYPSSKYVTGKPGPALAGSQPSEQTPANRSLPPAAGTGAAGTKPPSAAVRTPDQPASPAGKPATPGGKRTPGSQPAAQGPARPFALQVGAFSTEANAGKLRGAFATRGYSAEVIKRDREGRTLYLVWVGRYASEDEARSHIAEIKTQQNVTPIVVTR